MNVGKMDSFSNRPDFSKYFKSKARPASVVKNKSVCNEKHFQIDLKKKQQASVNCNDQRRKDRPDTLRKKQTIRYINPRHLK